MARALLGAVILAMTAVPLSSEVDCDNAYRTFMEGSGRSEIDGDRLASLHRAALRIFNACDSGHLQDPDARLRKLPNLLHPPLR
jgi:hypothetical protein